jgi:hypothetical protein
MPDARRTFVVGIARIFGLSADMVHSQQTCSAAGIFWNAGHAQIRVGVQYISKLELALPMRLDYLTWDFRRATHQDLNEAEK